MIEVKTYFKDWHYVSKEKAIQFIERKMSTIPDFKNKLEYINHRYLRGITVQELLVNSEQLQKYYAIAKYREQNMRNWGEMMFEI